MLCFTAGAGAAPSPPDGRVFELVTPADTGGVGPVNILEGHVLPLDDDTVVYGGSVVPSGPVQSGAQATYVARRGVFGWESTSLLPAEVGGGESYVLRDTTPDLSASVWTTESSSKAAVGPPPFNLPVQLRYRDAAGEFTTIATGTPREPPMYGGMSRDGRTVFFSARVPPGATPTGGGLTKVFAWHPDGSYETLGASGPPADCNVTLANQLPGASSVNAISVDGGTVFLTTRETPGVEGCPQSETEPQVYREVGGQTILVSESSAGKGLEPEQPIAYFRGASSDGSTAYLRTPAKLTSEDNEPVRASLYRWQAGVEPRLRCLTCGPSGEISRAGDNVISPDGSYLYFIKQTGTREPEQTTETLYVEHDGKVEEILNNTGLPGEILVGSGSFNAAGSVLVFQIVDGTRTQLYRVAVGPQAIAVGPLALNRFSEPITGPYGAFLGIHEHGSFPGSGAGEMRGNVSDDGTTIVFESAEALAYGATAGAPNAYRWHEGEIAYLGRIAEQEYPLGISTTPDGQDIFFVSPEQLTPGEGEIAQGVYDARVGGGFPPRPAPPTACDSPLTCQGPPSTAAASPSPARGRGSGNRPPKVLVLHRPSKADLAATARSGTLVLRLKAGGGGTVKALAGAMIRGHGRTVASATEKSPVAAKALNVRLRIDPPGRTQLREDGQLRLRISVSLAGAGSRSASVLLRGGK